MKLTHFFLLAALGTGIGCKRHLTTAQIKDNLEKSMAAYLKHEQDSLSSNLRFEMVDVDYFEEKDYYNCEFKVRLFRNNEHDTTGIIKGRVSKDFSEVSKKW